MDTLHQLSDEIDPNGCTQCRVMFSRGRLAMIKNPAVSQLSSYKIEFWDIEISDKFNAFYVGKAIHNWAQNRPRENR
jgi:hypothetical protein